MTIKEIYTKAIKYELEWLSILIEFLVFHKKVVQFDDQKEALDLYFKPNNRARMNELLIAYRKEIESS